MGSLIAFVLLLVVYLVSIKLIWLAYSSGKWPSVDGVILESKVIKKDYSDDPYFIPVIRYKYKVNSNYIESESVSYECFNFVLTRDQASQEASKYKIGDTVPVYYHPTKNAESVLIPGISNRQRALCVAVIIMSIIVISVVVSAQQI